MIYSLRHLLLALLLSFSAFAHASSNPAVQRLLLSAIDDVLLQRYDNAFQLADSIDRISPQTPDAWGLRATILHARHIDYEAYDDIRPFLAACDSTTARATLLLISKPEEAYFTYGAMAGFRANIYLRKGQWWNSAPQAISMKRNLDKAIAIKPGMTDAFVGLGNFDYWSSRKLNYLPFSGDKRELGIARLETALRSPINAAGAATALIWIEIDRGHPQRARALADSMLIKYPGSRNFLWGAAEAAHAQEDYPAVRTYYEQLLASVQADPGQSNRYNEIGCYHRLAEVSHRCGDLAAAKKYVAEALALPVSDEVQARKKNDYTDLNRWKKEWK